MKTILSIYAAVIGCAWVAVSANAATVRYVNANNASPNPPYTNWATAANILQDAIDVAQDGDEIVVTNGVCETGGYAVYPGMTNRVAVTKSVTLRSLHGPDVTIIRGRQAASNVIGQTGTTVYADTNAFGAGPFFYRVGVPE